MEVTHTLWMKSRKLRPRIRFLNSVSVCQGISYPASGELEITHTGRPLIKYSWHLGSCLLSTLLGPKGYLTEHQSSLTHLSLITCTGCHVYSRTMNEYDLSKFGNLQALTWIGPHTLSDYVTLRTCLTTNSPHLQALSLDLGGWDVCSFAFRDRDEISDNPTQADGFLIREVLSIPDSKDLYSDKSPFPKLTSLSLSQTPVGGAKTDLVRLFQALSFHQLKSLKLRNCDGMAPMLDQLAKEHFCGQLTHVEILAFDVNDWTLTDGLEVLPFLDTLSHLEDMFLFLEEADWSGIADTVCSHALSLKRVVLHQRALFIDDRYEYENEDTQKFTEELPLLCTDGLRRIFTEASCEMIGMSCDLDDLVSDT